MTDVFWDPQHKHPYIPNANTVKYDDEQKLFYATKEEVTPWPKDAWETLAWFADTYFARMEPYKARDTAVVDKLRKAWGLQ